MTDETPDPNDNDLLEKLRRMRDRFGDEPFLLEHVEKTIHALEPLSSGEDPENPPDDGP